MIRYNGSHMAKDEKEESGTVYEYKVLFHPTEGDLNGHALAGFRVAFVNTIPYVDSVHPDCLVYTLERIMNELP